MKKRIMIVDDDHFIRMAVRELFEYEGFEVVTASGGLECLAELKKGFTGVILMDIMMPELDGWDTIRMILEGGYYKNKNLLIAMLTARDKPDNKMDGLQEYITDYITKPFDNQELLDIVKESFPYLDTREDPS